MIEKPIAVILASIGVVSLCAVCALGPVVLGSAAGWVFGWIADLSPMATVGVAIFMALVAYALFRHWGAARRRDDSEVSTRPDVTEGENQ